MSFIRNLETSFAINFSFPSMYLCKVINLIQTAIPGNHTGNGFQTLNENIKSLSQFRSTSSHSGTYLIFRDLDVITLTIYVRINFYYDGFLYGKVAAVKALLLLNFLLSI